MEIDEGVISRGRRPMRTTPYYKLAQKKKTTNLHKKKQRILMAIGRNPEKKNHPVWD